MNDSTLSYADAPPYLSSNSVAVKATYRKITLRLIGFLFLYWVLNYLSRVNTSFAQL